MRRLASLPAGRLDERYADLLPELLDALGIDRAALIGNSIGGLRCLKGSERVTRAIAGVHARLYLRRGTPVVKQMLARAREERHQPARVAADAANWRSFTDPEHDLRERAAAISVLTLLVWGNRDPNLPLLLDGQWSEIDPRRDARSGQDRPCSLRRSTGPFPRDRAALSRRREPQFGR